jgi:hypothetical protein
MLENWSQLMDQAAIDASKKHLERATVALAVIEGASALKEIEVAWSDFLIASNRIFSKLEQGAKVNGKSTVWFGRKKHERRTNELLKYLHRARNADEHGIAQVTERSQPGLALGVGPGAWRFDGTFGPGGQVPGQSRFVEKIPSKVKLVRVYDTGSPYEPPKDESGKELLPNEAAQLALKYFHSMIEEVSQLTE